jgi:AcrR family transcriptional regulator
VTGVFDRYEKTEDALLRAAESLLEREGPDGVTTRAVCAAAKVRAPTLYHYFGDKNGLLDAVVAKGVKAFLKRKQTVRDTGDALADLISGWESFIGFALDHPQLFRLMVQHVGDNPQIVAAAMATTDARLIRLADEGRLATDVEFARHSLPVERRHDALDARFLENGGEGGRPLSLGRDAERTRSR